MSSPDLKKKNTISLPRSLIFPVAVLVLYGILYCVLPDETGRALVGSGKIFLSMLVPLGLVLVLMVVLNLFLKPAQIAGFLGRSAGIKGMLVSAVIGILSMGPVYAWYPLLNDLRTKGAGYRPISVFLYNRAVKPFLIPVMVGYFGWLYVVVLTILTVLASLVLGYAIPLFVKED